MEGKTLAVENFSVDDRIVHGDMRLVHFAYFLLENYYPVHDDLCKATGQALLRYHLGDKSQKSLVESLDLERKKNDELFFGK